MSIGASSIEAEGATSTTGPEVNGVLTGETLTLSGATITGTDVDSYTTVADYTWSVAKADGGDSTGNYTIEVTGTLTIQNAAAEKLGLKVENYNKPYDGASHSIKATAEVTEGTTIYYSTDNATWSETAPTWTDVEMTGEGEDAAPASHTVYVKAENPNYETALSSGTVTITPLAITVNDTKTETYNGKTQTLTIGADKATGVLDGETLTLTGAVISRKDKGSSTDVSKYSWSVAKADGSDSTGNYTIEVSGTLTIDPKSIKIDPIDNGKQYGEADPELKATVEGLIELGDIVHTIAYTVIREEGEAVDEYGMSISEEEGQEVAIKDENGADVTGNYDIETGTGTFTISEADISEDKNFNVSTLENVVYNGAEQRLEPVVTDKRGEETKTLVKDTDYTLSYSEDVTNVGTVTVTVTGIGSYTGTVTRTYQITPAPLTITVNDQNYTYNGSPQGENNATYTDAGKVDVNGLKGSDALTSITLNGRETDAGEYAGKIVASAAAIGEATGNYTIEYVAGKLTITTKAVEIKIDGSDDTQTYTGSPLTSETSVTPSCDDELFDASKFSYSGATTITKTDVGNYTEAIDITKAAYDDANLDVTFVAGTPVTFEITPASADELGLSVTSYSGAYDADAHTVTATTTVTEGTTISYSTDNETWSTDAPTWTDFTDGAKTV